MGGMILLVLIAAPGRVDSGPAVQTTPAARELRVTAGKSLVLDSPVNVIRVAVASAEVAEAVAVTPREVLINGKSPGETSLIVWQQGGDRLMFDLVVRPNPRGVEAIQRILREEVSRKDP